MSKFQGEMEWWGGGGEISLGALLELQSAEISTISPFSNLPMALKKKKKKAKFFRLIK